MVLNGESRFVQAGPVRLHYLEWPGDGTPLVLSPGTGLPAAVWRPFAAQISGHRLLALDHRGHGDSDKPPTGYDAVTLRDDFKAALDGLGLDRPYGVGHSLGGAVMVSVEAAYPGTFAKLILFDPPIGPPDSAGFAARASEMGERTRKKRAVWPDRAALYQSYRQRDVFADWREEAFLAYIHEGAYADERGEIHLKCPPDLEAQVFETHPQYDRWADLDRLDLAALLLQRVRQAQEVVVPSAGHFLPMSHPEQSARIVLDFLAH